MIGDNEIKINYTEPRDFDVFETKLGVCGKGGVAEIFDLNTSSSLWKARPQERHENTLDLSCLLKNHELIVGTGNNEIKIYDIRAARKAVKVQRLNPKDLSCDYAINTLSFSDNKEYMYAGDTIGHVYKINMQLVIIGKTKGRSVGSIRAIQESSGFLYSCGLDRNLRIHELGSLQLAEKKYLWQKLNSILVMDK